MHFAKKSKTILGPICCVFALAATFSSALADDLFTYTDPATTMRSDVRVASVPTPTPQSTPHSTYLPASPPQQVVTQYFPPAMAAEASPTSTGLPQTTSTYQSDAVHQPNTTYSSHTNYQMHNVYQPTTTAYESSVADQIGEHQLGTQCSCARCQRTRLRESESFPKLFAINQGFGPSRCTEECWDSPNSPPFNVYGPGEYAGPARIQRIPEYRLRSGDAVEMTFMLVPMRTQGEYRLVVGDELIIESEQDEALNRGDFTQGIQVQPDGTITLRYIGQVHAAGQTINQLRELINEKYTGLYKEPEVDVTPLRTGTAAMQIRDAVTGSGGFAGQQLVQTITPSGEIRLPRLGSVQAQGLTLDELKVEINTRYQAIVGGLEIEPALQAQAPHQIFVLGEVATPGRFDLNNSPTSVLGAVALAGGHVSGANLRQIVIFRRGEAYELMSTTLDLRGAILGKRSNPTDEIWLRDGDVIVVPSTPIRLINNLVRQVFTEGIYGVLPTTFQLGSDTSF